MPDNILDVTELARLKMLQASLGRIVHLTGYAVALNQRSLEQEITAIAVEALAEQETDMAVADILKAAAAEARAAAEAGKAAAQKVADAINSAIGRLSDNQSITEEEKNAILADLNAAKVANEEGAAISASGEAAAGTIDPEVPGGVVTDPENPGGVVEG